MKKRPAAGPWRQADTVWMIWLIMPLKKVMAKASRMANTPYTATEIDIKMLLHLICNVHTYHFISVDISSQHTSFPCDIFSSGKKFSFPVKQDTHTKIKQPWPHETQAHYLGLFLEK